MWRVTADNGLPRCQGYRWVRFGPLGANRQRPWVKGGRENQSVLELSAGLSPSALDRDFGEALTKVQMLFVLQD